MCPDLSLLPFLQGSPQRLPTVKPEEEPADRQARPVQFAPVSSLAPREGGGRCEGAVSTGKSRSPGLRQALAAHPRAHTGRGPKEVEGTRLLLGDPWVTTDA